MGTKNEQKYLFILTGHISIPNNQDLEESKLIKKQLICIILNKYYNTS